MKSIKEEDDIDIGDDFDLLKKRKKPKLKPKPKPKPISVKPGPSPVPGPGGTGSGKSPVPPPGFVDPTDDPRADNTGTSKIPQPKPPKDQRATKPTGKPPRKQPKNPTQDKPEADASQREREKFIPVEDMSYPDIVQYFEKGISEEGKSQIDNMLQRFKPDKKMLQNRKDIKYPFFLRGSWVDPLYNSREEPYDEKKIETNNQMNSLKIIIKKYNEDILDVSTESLVEKWLYIVPYFDVILRTSSNIVKNPTAIKIVKEMADDFFMSARPGGNIDPDVDYGGNPYGGEVVSILLDANMQGEETTDEGRKIYAYNKMLLNKLFFKIKSTKVSFNQQIRFFSEQTLFGEYAKSLNTVSTEPAVAPRQSFPRPQREENKHLSKKDIKQLIKEAFIDKVYGKYPYSHQSGAEDEPVEDYIEEWKRFCLGIVQDKTKEQAIALAKVFIQDLELFEDVLDLAGQNQSIGTEILKKMQKNQKNMV